MAPSRSRSPVVSTGTKRTDSPGWAAVSKSATRPAWANARTDRRVAIRTSFMVNSKCLGQHLHPFDTALGGPDERDRRMEHSTGDCMGKLPQHLLGIIGARQPRANRCTSSDTAVSACSTKAAMTAPTRSGAESLRQAAAAPAQHSPPPQAAVGCQQLKPNHRLRGSGWIHLAQVGRTQVAYPGRSAGEAPCDGRRRRQQLLL